MVRQSLGGNGELNSALLINLVKRRHGMGVCDGTVGKKLRARSASQRRKFLCRQNGRHDSLPWSAVVGHYKEGL